MCIMKGKDEVKTEIQTGFTALDKCIHLDMFAFFHELLNNIFQTSSSHSHIFGYWNKEKKTWSFFLQTVS